MDKRQDQSQWWAPQPRLGLQGGHTGRGAGLSSPESQLCPSGPGRGTLSNKSGSHADPLDLGNGFHPTCLRRVGTRCRVENSISRGWSPSSGSLRRGCQGRLFSPLRTLVMGLWEGGPMWQMVFSKNGHKNNSSPTYSLRTCHCPTNRGSVSSAMEHRVRCGVDLDGCLDE